MVSAETRVLFRMPMPSLERSLIVQRIPPEGVVKPVSMVNPVVGSPAMTECASAGFAVA